MPIIVKLPDETIKLIAAGEVVTKPVNVVKEVLENSLDANATNIRVTFEQGGQKLIEIIDNGDGIAKANAELLCHRYATSKLHTSNDLLWISTFGFRGEALASISEVADVEVSSFNTVYDKSGWKAFYKHGTLVNGPVEKPMTQSGTHIRITNLFSNFSIRKSVLKVTFIDEKKSIQDLIIRYGLHHRQTVTMSLKEGNKELVCILAPMALKDCLGMLFGIEFAQNLLQVVIDHDENFRFEALLAFSYKKSSTFQSNLTFILFVNDRLVENSELKKEMECLIFEYIATKIYAPFVYLSIKVPTHEVDINNHPAKTTVLLHYNDEITTCILSAFRKKLHENLDNKFIGICSQSTKTLTTSSSSGTIVTQNLVTMTSKFSSDNKFVDKGTPSPLIASKPQPNPSSRPYELVHNDSTQQTLNQKMVSPKIPKRNLNLRSINELKSLVSEEAADDSEKIIKNSVFVGIFDHHHGLIQLQTRLYAINIKNYIREQIYQFYLYDFGNFQPIEIMPPGNNLKFMIHTYLEDIRIYESSKHSKLKYPEADAIIEKLMSHSEMFSDYLNLKLTKDEVVSIPSIWPNQLPNLVYLGKFLVELANDVDYNVEILCFKQIGRLISDFYSEPPPNLKDYDVHKKYHENVERKLLPTIKNYLIIPKWLFTKTNLCQISDTKDLYKVFERC